MFNPINDRIFIKPDEVEEKTASGIFVVDNKKEKAVTGVVVKGNKELKKGDRVLFSKFGYDEVEIDNETFYVVSFTNVLGKFND